MPHTNLVRHGLFTRLYTSGDYTANWTVLFCVPTWNAELDVSYLTYIRLLCFLAEVVLSGALRAYYEPQVSKTLWDFSPWAHLDKTALPALGTLSHSALTETLRTAITKQMALERKAAHNKSYAQTPNGKASKTASERQRGADPEYRARKKVYLAEHREKPDIKAKEAGKRRAYRATPKGKAKRAEEKRRARAKKKAAA